jgi:hypothetical protein
VVIAHPLIPSGNLFTSKRQPKRSRYCFECRPQVVSLDIGDWGVIPTFKCIVSFETANKILPINSAVQNLSAARKTGVHWTVVVGGGGNSCAQVR